MNKQTAIDSVTGNEIELKANQLWRTKSGRTVILTFIADEHGRAEIGMIWFDEVDNELCSAYVLDRLQTFMKSAYNVVILH